VAAFSRVSQGGSRTVPDEVAPKHGRVKRLSDLSQLSARQQLRQYERLGCRNVPVQKRAKETVDLILDTAAALIDEVGVVAFTTNLLAERAGIRIRTIYRYFPNKLGILMALTVRLYGDITDQMQAFSEFADPERDWRAAVDRWIEEIMMWTRDQPAARLLIDWGQGIPELTAMLEKFDEEFGRHLARAMHERGVDLPPKQLYAVCRSFGETLDALASIAAMDDQDCTAELIEEARRMLFGYLSRYLD
jgi:AcrR family transcriptional regulator